MRAFKIVFCVWCLLLVLASAEDATGEGDDSHAKDNIAAGDIDSHNTQQQEPADTSPPPNAPGGAPDHDIHDVHQDHSEEPHEDDIFAQQHHDVDEHDEEISHIDDSMVCKDGNCEMDVDGDKTLLVGAVAYDPKVITFWESVKSYVKGAGRELEMDFVLYSNYERLVEALLHGFVHIIWASPLAFVELEQVAASRGLTVNAFVMRDTDRDQKSVIVVKKDSPISSLSQLKGKVVAVGAGDSPQSTLIPLHFIKESGRLELHTDFTIQRHDLLLGKHGDHVAGEQEAAAALNNATADAACMSESNYKVFVDEGIFDAASTRILATTGTYDHFLLMALQGFDDFISKQSKKLSDLLLAMDSSADAHVAEFLKIENCKKWLPARTSGFTALKNAVTEFGYIKEFLQHHGAGMGPEHETEDAPKTA